MNRWPHQGIPDLAGQLEPLRAIADENIVDVQLFVPLPGLPAGATVTGR